MNEKETIPSESGQKILEQGITELVHEQVLFTESVYAHIPISVEIYDTDGFLRFINDHALKMYGQEVSDRNTVIGIVNLFSSPYMMDANTPAPGQNGEENTWLKLAAIQSYQ